MRKELLATVESVENFYHYLYARKSIGRMVVVSVQNPQGINSQVAAETTRI